MVDIYFDDLIPEKQQELLDAFGLADPAEMNWDVLPLSFVAPPHVDEKKEEAPAGAS